MLQNYAIKETSELGKNVTAYLGNPWDRFTRTVVMQSDIVLFVNSSGWIEFIFTLNLPIFF